MLSDYLPSRTLELEYTLTHTLWAHLHTVTRTAVLAWYTAQT
jgi:hypothetical protein